jgi:2-furoyl-CoA dehydrogenase large subunit
VEAVDSTHFSVVSGLGIGAVKLKFKLDVELSDIVEPERLRMAARGRAPGSVVDVTSSVRLEEAGNGRTRLNWSATSTVGGTVASVGVRLLEGTARRLTE